MSATPTLNPQGRVNVRRIGLRRQPMRDLYLGLMRMRWRWLIALLLLSYLFNVSVFGLLYSLQDGAIANARVGSFRDAFFFSVHTLSTIGYGHMWPRTTYANVIVTIQAFSGMLTVTLFAGLVFAKFSRATARLIFSEKAVISLHDGVPTLMIRIANERSSNIVDTRLTLTLLREAATQEGAPLVRFVDMKLLRNWMPLFAVTWTAYHPIDAQSPLFGLAKETLAEQDFEIIATLSGTDEIYNQLIHARTSYIPEDIVFNARFSNLLDQDQEGRTVDFSRFNDLEML